MALITPTILSIKQNFLIAQTRLLSQPLRPSPAWPYSNEADGQRISERAIDNALLRLNNMLQQHARRVYAPVATRHVAEQIEGLYLAYGERYAGKENSEYCVYENSWRMVGADYANAEIALSLPTIWESKQDISANPLEAKRYTELVKKLQRLSAYKEEAEVRIKRLQKIKAVLEPFKTDSSSIQENLITSDGEVERELEHMRILLVHVGNKIVGLKEWDSSSNGECSAMIVDDVEVEERRKVDGLLDRLIQDP